MNPGLLTRLQLAWHHAHDANRVSARLGFSAMGVGDKMGRVSTARNREAEGASPILSTLTRPWQLGSLFAALLEPTL